MSQVYVKTYGPFAVDGRVVVNPGSVVLMDEGIAEVFINRGRGEAASGPVFYAPPSEESVRADAEVERLRAAIEEAPYGSMERQELGDKLQKAQRDTMLAQLPHCA